MKQLIWKEAREILKWALLGLAILFIACFYALSSRPNGDGQNITFCHPTFLMVTSFGYAIFGIALAGLQLIPEFSRDQWSTLLHRPVARGGVLLAKIIVGMTAYVLCTLLPLAACVVYVATPGNFAAPFTPLLLLPALSDWYVGLCLYALTLLICLHKGRWMGARGILALAGAFIFIVHLLPYLPFSLPLVALGIFMVAAMGAIHSGRVIKLRPRFTRGAFVAAILIGCCGLMILIFSGYAIFGRGYYSFDSAYKGFLLTSEGQVLSSEPDKDLGKSFLFDEEGRNVTDQYDGTGQSNLRFPDHYLYGDSFDYRDASFFLRNSSLIARPLAYGNRREQWYYLDHQNYIIGYDRITRQCLGIIDRSGFHSDELPIQPFPTPNQLLGIFFSGERFYLKTPTEVLLINVVDRSVTPIYQLEGSDLLAFMAFGFDMEDPQFFVAALKTEIQILDRSGKKLFSVPYAHDRTKWGYLSIATDQSANRFFFGYQSILSPQGEPRPQYLVVTDNTGKTLHQYELSPDTPTKPSIGKKIRGMLAAPPVIQTLSYLNNSQPTYFQNLLFAKPGKNELLIIWGVSLLLASFTILLARRQRRTWSTALGWGAIVLLFGIPGLLAFRLASDWPTHQACPNCQAKRPIEKELCPSCSSTWPSPATTGAEVFERLPEQAFR